MPITINPHTLYSREDLLEILAQLGINADRFIARISPRKIFRQAFWGQHLIEALDNAESGTGFSPVYPPSTPQSGASRGTGVSPVYPHPQPGPRRKRTPKIPPTAPAPAKVGAFSLDELGIKNT